MSNEIKDSSNVLLDPHSTREVICYLTSKLGINKWDIGASSSNDFSLSPMPMTN